MLYRRLITIFILVMSFFLLGILKVNALSWEDSLGGIPVIITNCLSNGSDEQDIHVELMVLKSDFSNDELSTTINENYKNTYPEYASYTHLQTDDEISYYAYVKEASMSRYECAYEYATNLDHEKQITYVRFIIFTSDGEVLATSPQYEHVHADHFSVVDGFYYADLNAYTIDNDRTLVFNMLLIILWIALIFLSFAIILLKYGFGMMLKIKYVNPNLSWIIDVILTMSCVFLLYYLYNVPQIRYDFTMIGIMTIFFLIQFLIGYFVAIKKESRNQLIILTFILYVLVTSSLLYYF
ncbi:MAG: hypothetical protein KKH01_08045 [Firmicutes bacterium]|nr:hypothetical protein [Bacillota bacterium]